MADTKSTAVVKKAYPAYLCSRLAPYPFQLITSSVIRQYHELEPMDGRVMRTEYHTRNRDPEAIVSNTGRIQQRHQRHLERFNQKHPRRRRRRLLLLEKVRYLRHAQLLPSQDRRPGRALKRRPTPAHLLGQAKLRKVAMSKGQKAIPHGLQACTNLIHAYLLISNCCPLWRNGYNKNNGKKRANSGIHTTRNSDH